VCGEQSDTAIITVPGSSVRARVTPTVVVTSRQACWTALVTSSEAMIRQLANEACAMRLLYALDENRANKLIA
jgi:hypothetical protein